MLQEALTHLNFSRSIWKKLPCFLLQNMMINIQTCNLQCVFRYQSPVMPLFSPANLSWPWYFWRNQLASNSNCGCLLLLVKTFLWRVAAHCALRIKELEQESTGDLEVLKSLTMFLYNHPRWPCRTDHAFLIARVIITWIGSHIWRLRPCCSSWYTVHQPFIEYLLVRCWYSQELSSILPLQIRMTALQIKSG